VVAVNRATTSTDRGLGIEVDRWRVPAAYVIATVGSVIAAGILLPFRADVAHTLEAFLFLVPVVIASWLGGVGPGVAAAIVSSALFNFGFLPPYGTFDLERPEYLGAFLAFLAMSLVISWLVGVARERATAAEDREAEVRLLFDLSHVLVSERAEGLVPALARAAERLGFVMAVVRDADAGEGDGLGFPLRVGGAAVGWLVFVGDRPSLTRAETRVVRTFADEVALVVSGERLEADLREAELYRRAEDMRRSLLAAASHELKSPVAAITASVTDVLGRDRLDPEVVREVLEDVRASTSRLEQLITNLLDMSRIESGTLVARSEIVHLDDLVGPAVEGVRGRWPGVDIDIDIAEDAGRVRGDALFVERIVTNLVENAARAVRGAADRRIELRGALEGEMVALRVIDHGPGLNFGDHALLFTPFYRLQDGSARLGAGLGLAICKGFAIAMGGEIRATDTPGGGATFVVLVPAAP
jgi:two-component system sensor histidine kinase KdpD